MLARRGPVLASAAARGVRGRWPRGDTSSARAIGLVTVHRRHGETVYRVFGRPGELTTITVAAVAVAAERTRPDDRC